jgi:glycine cleavage system aminomethyltransferase T
VAGSIWEGWLVRDKTIDFVGREAVERARGERGGGFVGLRLEGAVEVGRGTAVRRGERQVGVVTSSAFSPAAGETLCLAHVEPEALEAGGPLELGPPAAPAALVAQRATLPFRPRHHGVAPRLAAPREG